MSFDTETPLFLSTDSLWVDDILTDPESTPTLEGAIVMNHLGRVALAQSIGVPVAEEILPFNPRGCGV